MKKIFNILAMVGLLTGSIACSDQLETVPTDQVSGNVIFSDVDGAMVAMNGVYRMTYTAGWSDGNEHQNFGYMSTALFADLMGDDMVQHEMGSGWFYFDYNHQARIRYTSKAWRSYATWNYYYTLISNVNYILAREGDAGLAGASDKKASLFAQAHTMRALSYFYLIQLFQQTYVGNESAPGVPLYTEPTQADTEGKPRGTVEEVYTLINQDLDKAIELFTEAGVAQEMKSHIDLYTAYGIKARVALVQNKWNVAAEAAKNALAKPGLNLSSPADLTKGMNRVEIPSVMWGAPIQIAEQSTVYASFYAHMDPNLNAYGDKSRKCISVHLYDQIPETDFRKGWWLGKLAVEESTGPNASYCQTKFAFSDPKNYLGDYIYMRAEEMYLIQAEALCRQNKFDEARQVMTTFGSVRDSEYADRLASFKNAATLTKDANGTCTAAQVVTLLDEILFQRRVELWGEFGRIFDILRLKTGMDRKYEGSNHTEMLTPDTKNPACKAFILTIPQSEFDGNVNMNASTDQNPL